MVLGREQQRLEAAEQMMKMSTLNNNDLLEPETTSIKYLTGLPVHMKQAMIRDGLMTRTSEHWQKLLEESDEKAPEPTEEMLAFRSIPE